MERLATLAVRHALPAIFPYREFALAGGLMSYGSNLSYVWHQAGIYTGRLGSTWPAPTESLTTTTTIGTLQVACTSAKGQK